ncbi:M28 family peptidase [Planctomicrobium piriforme]|uniref:Peptidase family M28 n=1 Tax=Planctomicrobium piriforme TaxID=1576369 RepID=A0A1I3G7D0_9PLAN|nr:M28 family peptidase [Planctomicrobium piriforme]SFI19386.1 Peptidase family M28 [Planctomicrobium piriforme]
MRPRHEFPRHGVGELFRIFTLLVCCLTLPAISPAQENRAPAFDGRRAFSYLEAICAIGPRISGTPGMARQQELIERHFTALGAEVRYQDFDVAHPETGQPVRMRNMIVSWQPQAEQRLLVCCHYDTRPRPDREPLPFQRDKPFIGANDGGSGIAVLMELGNLIAAMQPRPAVDFVFFDGEELVYDPQDKYFLGAEHFAKSYRDRPAGSPRYEQGVLLDLVAGQNANFYYEVNSLRYAPEVTRSIWETAQRLGIKEFVARRKHEVLDDHLALNTIAGIPTCDIIDFDYPHWHRRNDLPGACSAATLSNVGRVIFAWLQANAKSPVN